MVLPQFRLCEMCDDTDESRARLVWRRRRPAGVVPLLEGVTNVCQDLPRLLEFGCCLRVKASIRSWIGTMAASFSMSLLYWEHCAGRHCLEVLGSLLRCSPLSRLISRDAMHALAGELKMTSSRDRSNSSIFSSGGASTREVFFGVVALWRCLASVETRFCLLSFG
jgi:hypothetical protein